MKAYGVISYLRIYYILLYLSTHLDVGRPSGLLYRAFCVRIYIIMVITHHSGQCFKVTLGDLTLVFDPISKESKLPKIRFGANIALVSRNHPDMNGVEEVSSGDKTLFTITGPGEYERQSVVIQGFLSESKYPLSSKTTDIKDAKIYINTIYSVELEDMTLVHLGALSDTELSKEARESIDKIDVLFVPIGGDGVLDPAKAHELAVSLEPKIIIPMHWSMSDDQEHIAESSKSLETFLKESGNGSEKLGKLTLKKKDLEEHNGSIIVLTS